MDNSSNGSFQSRRTGAANRCKPRPNRRMLGHRLQISLSSAFTIEETAHRLGFRHRSTIYELIQRGELRACRLGGGSLRVPEDAIVEYLQNATDAEL
jgi:excisionase family DNA binding protein